MTCGIDNCTRTYTKYDSFRKHIQRSHPNVGDPTVDETESNLDGDTMDNNISEHSSLDFTHGGDAEDPMVDPMKANTLFLLKAKEVHKVSQIALDEMMSDFVEICKRGVENLRAKVDHCLHSNGIEPSSIPDLPKVFTDSSLNDPFCGLNSAYRQEQYFTDHLQLVVSKQPSLILCLIVLRNMHLQIPKEYKLGRNMVRCRRGARTQWCLTWDSAYVIPLLSSLKQLLNNESVLAEVSTYA